MVTAHWSTPPPRPQRATMPGSAWCVTGEIRVAVASRRKKLARWRKLKLASDVLLRGAMIIPDAILFFPQFATGRSHVARDLEMYNQRVTHVTAPRSKTTICSFGRPRPAPTGPKHKTPFKKILINYYYLSGFLPRWDCFSHRTTPKKGRKSSNSRLPSTDSPDDFVTGRSTKFAKSRKIDKQFQALSYIRHISGHILEQERPERRKRARVIPTIFASTRGAVGKLGIYINPARQPAL